MQIDLQTNEQLINVLRGSGTIAVIPAKGAGLDAFCAGLALYLMLKGLDKSAKLFYPGTVPEVCKDLIQTDDIITSFSQRQLTVAIDYSGEHAARAWYEPENETLKVKLAPVSKEFNPDLKVRTRLDLGFDYDTAIILGANELEDLGYVYAEIRNELAKSTIINLSNSGKNTRFGSINVIDPTADSLSQLVIKKAPLWELTITTQAAQALLTGITQK
ncbi:hypothetical protein KJ605_02030 [Patescibacteria group bacterium]|nr:hypothetical protein [Patescibacteria group bacterium]MBU1970530.1 hypothetical protein [Patescibacteria group bacterium]